MLPIQYSMKNLVNGTPMTISGIGNWFDNGRMALNLTLSTIPDDWTGAIGPCICSGPGPGPKPRSDIPGGMTGLIGFAPNGYKTELGTLRRATLWDETGAEIANVSATGVYEKTKERFNFDINVETNTKAHSIISKLHRIDNYNFTIAPNGKGKVIVISMYQLSTPDGKTAHGVTHINYEMINSDFELTDIIAGKNTILVQQIDNSIQWITHQNTISSAKLGVNNSVIPPLSNK